MQKKWIVISVIFILGFLLVGKAYVLTPHLVSTQTLHVTVSPYPKQTNKNEISYSGKKGIDALTLLKERGLVEQNETGLVKSIGGREANDKIHEYWAFYVNGKMAQVGPAQYITNDGDKIVWKVEKY